jgi:hypothetical protein
VDLDESRTQSFVVRLWLEERAEPAGRAVWRGHVTHVPSGRRRYVQYLSEITDFIAPYVEGMAARCPTWRVIARRLRRRGRSKERDR